MTDDVPRNDKGRCALCGGPGYKPTGEFCDCPIGRDLADYDRWNKAKAPKAQNKPQDKPPGQGGPIPLPKPKDLNGGLPGSRKRAKPSDALSAICFGYTGGDRDPS